MNWYKEDGATWREIIETVAAEVRRTTQMVEKDTIQNMQERDSRHLYDIAKLYPKVEINQELESLIDRVREDRMQSKSNPSAQLGYNIPGMLREIIGSRCHASGPSRQIYTLPCQSGRTEKRHTKRTDSGLKN